MAWALTNPSSSLFDFGPLAHEYEIWYNTPAGQAHDLVQKQNVRELLRPARALEQLLDVGCGTGHWSRFFRSLGYEVHGIDISEKMVLVARATVPECVFDIADACVLPFKNASFDIVASMAALEFIPDPTVAVREMARCVKPGGSILIGTLNRLAPVNRDRLSEGEQPYASGHLFSPDELRDLLSPWGELRMAASSGSSRPPGPLPLVANHRSPPQGSLEGPFIVAEVRR